jgi:hypothetical protein
MNIEFFKEPAQRFLNLLLKPEEESAIIASEKPQVLDVIFPYTTFGLIILIIATLIGCILRPFKVNIFFDILFSLSIYIVPLIIFCFCTKKLSTYANAFKSELSIQVCLYSFSPAWVISFFNLIPVASFGWIWVILSIVTISYVHIKISTDILGIPESKKIQFFLLSITSLSLPMLILETGHYLWFISTGAM